MSHATTSSETIRDAQPTIETNPAAPPSSFQPLRDLAEDLQGAGPDRRYPTAIAEAILESQSTEIAFQVVVDSVPEQLVTCHHLTACPSHVVLEIATIHGEEEEATTTFALPTLSEASYYLLYKVIDALETETPLDIQALDECVLDVLGATAPDDLQPAIEEILRDLS